MLGVVSQNRVGRNGNALEPVSLSVVENLGLFSQEVGYFENEICFFRGEGLSLFVGLVEG